MQDQEITRTAVCDAGRHWLCRGSIFSLTREYGASCLCPCHEQDDAATDQAKDLDRWAAA